MVVALLTVARLMVDAPVPLPMTVRSEEAVVLEPLVVCVLDDLEVTLAEVLDAEF